MKATTRFQLVPWIVFGLCFVVAVGVGLWGWNNEKQLARARERIEQEKHDAALAAAVEEAANALAEEAMAAVEEIRASAIAKATRAYRARQLLREAGALAPVHKWNYLDTDLQVGDVGLVRSGRITVVQVINPIDMLVHWDTRKTLLLWVTGIATKGLADDMTYDVGTCVWAITGTRTYTTALGAAKTVFVAELDEVATRRAIAYLRDLRR